MNTGFELDYRLSLITTFLTKKLSSYLGKTRTLFGRTGVKNSYAIQVALEESNGWHRANHRQMFLTNDQSALMN